MSRGHRRLVGRREAILDSGGRYKGAAHGSWPSTSRRSVVGSRGFARRGAATMGKARGEVSGRARQADPCRPVEGMFSRFAKDLYGGKPATRPARTEQIDVAMVGAGLAGPTVGDGRGRTPPGQCGQLPHHRGACVAADRGPAGLTRCHATRFTRTAVLDGRVETSDGLSPLFLRLYQVRDNDHE
jgi:hypothetical protein